MSVVAVKKDTAAKWLEEFRITSANRLGVSNKDVEKIQQEAIKRFAETGIPDKKIEDYKYTNIRLYLNDEFGLNNKAPYLKPSDIRDYLIPGAYTIAMINGKFLKELSLLKELPKEITVKNLFSALKESGSVAGAAFNGQFIAKAGPMALLNTALTRDGLSINIPEGFESVAPIHILHVSTGNEKGLYNPRNIIKIGRDSIVTIIESYVSVDLSEKAFTNSVTEITVEEGATLNNYIIQEENSFAAHNNIRRIQTGKEAHVNHTVVTLDGGLIRNDLEIDINGENAEIHMHGLFVVKKDMHVDNHTLVEHNVANCFSNELYKGIIEDGGTGVFNGKIYVKQDAQKTNAYQSNKNILLGDDATINTKPQLEIYADDVKCSHGTTTGKINEDALFYLQTRGLSESIAKKVLLKAFAGEISDTVKNSAFRQYIEHALESHIA